MLLKSDKGKKEWEQSSKKLAQPPFLKSVFGKGGKVQ